MVKMAKKNVKTVGEMRTRILALKSENWRMGNDNHAVTAPFKYHTAVDQNRE